MGLYINEVVKWLASHDFMRVMVFVDDIYMVTNDKEKNSLHDAGTAPEAFGTKGIAQRAKILLPALQQGHNVASARCSSLTEHT